jgi:hypothetical protein
MKVDLFQRTQTLELQQKFLRNLLHTKPSKFKELSIMLKEYSKREINLGTVYERLLGKSIYSLISCVTSSIFISHHPKALIKA